MKKILIITMLSMLFVGCNIVVVLLSPSKQRTKDKTIIPKKPDFLLKNNEGSMDMKVAYTMVNPSYRHYNGEIHPSSVSFVFGLMEDAIM